MAEAAREPRRGLSFEDVWAMFQETDRKFQETDRLIRQTQLEIREAQKETERKMQETDRKMRETDRKMKETDRQIGRLGNRLGDLIEHLTASNLLDQFKLLNYSFTRISRNIRIRDPNNRILTEIDLLLENGEYTMVVEVKSLLTLMDVKEHIKRMETLRRYADIHQDKRKYVSSVSGALIEEEAGGFALEKGIYVIEHPGETVEILVPKTVRAW
jgi:hypothetical protein